MTDNQVPMSVESNRRGDTVEITLGGELDLHTSELLTAAIEQAVAAGPRTVVLDADGLSFADSAGLRALLTARDTAQQSDIELRLARVSPALGRLLDVTGLREVFGSPAS